MKSEGTRFGKTNVDVSDLLLGNAWKKTSSIPGFDPQNPRFIDFESLVSTSTTKLFQDYPGGPILAAALGIFMESKRNGIIPVSSLQAPLFNK